MSDVKIYVLHCGTITLDEKVAFGTKHPQLMKVKAQLTPERKRITLPNCAYLVASKSGLVLIDTGWSRDISPNGVPDADAATDFTSAFIWNLYHGHVGPGQTAMEKLEAMGIRPEDLNCVLFTTLVAGLFRTYPAYRGAGRVLLFLPSRSIPCNISVFRSAGTGAVLLCGNNGGTGLAFSGSF